MIKTLSKVGVEGSFLNMIFQRQKLKDFPLMSGAKQVCLLSSLLFNIVLEVPATMIRQKKKKEMKGFQIGK